MHENTKTDEVVIYSEKLVTKIFAIFPFSDTPDLLPYSKKHDNSILFSVKILAWVLPAINPGFSLIHGLWYLKMNVFFLH